MKIPLPNPPLAKGRAGWGCLKVKKIFNEQLIISKFFLNLKIILDSTV